MNLKLSIKTPQTNVKNFQKKKKILKTEQTPKNNNMISNNLRIKKFFKNPIRTVHFGKTKKTRKIYLRKKLINL